jgi:hypothetical protein
MPAIAVNQPFPIFTDADGQPLDDAYIYIGTANQNPVSNPITVYWDAALTIAAAQPIRTSGGYPIYNGSPARFYANSDYSILVRDKNGAFVYTSPKETDFTSSEFISFVQSGTGAVSRTSQSKMQDVVSVKDFGAVGDGVTDDTAAIQACLNAATAYTEIRFPGVFLVTSGITVTGKNNLLLTGGTIKTQANITALTFSSCTNITVSLNFVGPVNSQQYEVVLSGSAMADLFNSFTQTELLTNAAASSNSTATKVGNVVTVALTSDAGLSINRGALSSIHTINSGDRYVVFIDSGFASGVATAAPRFYRDSVEWNPQYSSNFNYITGATSFQVKVGTGRIVPNATYSTISGYTGAAYDISKISLVKLVNESATQDFSGSFGSFLFFSNCTSVRVASCTFKNGYIAASTVNCNFVDMLSNTVAQCFAGLGTTTSSNVRFDSNSIDLRWLDNTGAYRDFVHARFKGIAGTMSNQSGLIISNNTIRGACWGIEYTSSTDVIGAQINNNNIYSPRTFISVNKFKFSQINNNYCLSTDAFAFSSGAIETSDNSSDIQLIGNTCISSNICGQTNVGLVPTGNNYCIKSNYIRAAIPISKTGFAGGSFNSIDISENTLMYGSIGLFIRELNVSIRNNSIKNLGNGYLDGVGYLGGTYGLSVEMFANDSPTLITIRDNEIDGGLAYIGYINFLRMDFSNNIITQKYNPLRGIYGVAYASATSSVNHQFINNRLYSTGGYDPRSQGLIIFTGVPAAGGSCVMKNQNPNMNVTNYSGTGSVVTYDGAFGGGAAVWNPGTINDGTYVETTVAGVAGAFGCAYSVAPPYDVQGCMAYAYYDGTNTKLRVQNETGGSVTLGSGTWKVMADRARY